MFAFLKQVLAQQSFRLMQEAASIKKVRALAQIPLLSARRAWYLAVEHQHEVSKEEQQVDASKQHVGARQSEG